MFYLNGNPLKVTLFPDNTSQIWQLSNEILQSELIEITWRFDSEAEFMHLAQLKSLLDKYTLNDVIAGDQLVEVFRDSKSLINENFNDIRARLLSYK